MSDATQAVTAWLDAFGAALERGDHAAAAAMFDDDCYWRDLVSFTWNIKTLEGRDADPGDARRDAAQARSRGLADRRRGDRGRRRHRGLVHLRDRAWRAARATCG